MPWAGEGQGAGTGLGTFYSSGVELPSSSKFGLGLTLGFVRPLLANGGYTRSADPWTPAWLSPWLSVRIPSSSLVPNWRASKDKDLQNKGHKYFVLGRV